ncbi:MAG: DUF1206 domain-containing protein [Bacteroidota bacterium]
MANAEDWIKNYARIGLYSKAAVYILMGGLATLAVFNIGGKTSGKDGTMQFVMSQPMGKIMLAIIALGLVGYVVWRMIQTLKNPENSDVLPRIGYAFSGVFYALIAFSALQMLIVGGSGGGESSDKKEYFLSTLLTETWGQIAVIGISLAFFGRAIFQLYRGLSGKYANKLAAIDMDERARQVLLKAGLVGYVARAVVIGIIGSLFLEAAIEHNSSEAGSTEEAFAVLQQSFAGPLLLGIVALGLVAYGAFMIFKGRYRIMPDF